MRIEGEFPYHRPLKGESMREIKFRAWHTEMNCMCSWEEILLALKSDHGRLMFPEKLPEVLPKYFIREIDSAVRVIYNYEIFGNPKIILMQSTGLHDKNGKEIWEGDIVRYQSFTDGQIYTSKVHFENGCFCGGGVWLKNLVWEHCEVLGNIYEHNHLLKG